MSMNVLQLRYSDDGGENMSPWRDLDAGETGSFVKEIVTRRLGMTRQRVWEIRDSSPVAIDILGAMIE